MWQANKTAIIALLIGLALLGGTYCYLAPGDIDLARKAVSLGFCALLFCVGLYSLLTARK